MHIWTIENWEKYLDRIENRRTGLRFKYESSIDSELKREFKEFANWMKSEYYFPLRMPIYVKNRKFIKAVDGDSVVGTFFEPFSYSDEPYIKIAVGDYNDLKETLGKNKALEALFLTVAHELTHYYQWINHLPLTPIGRERQATRYSQFIVDEYFESKKDFRNI